ncbi:MAG: hypothetical protein IT365_01770 [Candidatus Hydrogenedentes bacterium]|nr:hypothetical protein [Candidatus Hydrogenedentota bacterium]
MEAGVPEAGLLTMLAWWCWPLPFAALAWWLLRRFPREVEQAPEPEWLGRPLTFRLEPLDRISLAILAGLAVFLWLGRNTVFPIPPDAYYHLLVARQVYETGTIPLWNTWEWAPLGRPHLYPPGYHLLLAAAAIPFRGDFLAAFRWLTPAILPFAYFTTWYLARWLFDARRAFVALLIVGMDAVLVFSAVMGTPGVLATSLISIFFVLFLSGRTIPAAVVAVLAVYTHLGIPALAFLGLLIFSLINRAHLPRLLCIALMTALAAAPWYARVFVFRDWFSHPIDLGVYGEFTPWMRSIMKFTWLQMANVFLMVAVVLAIPRIQWREKRNQLLLAFLVALLPMLFSYGGRYYIHTIHIWAIVAAALFTGFLKEPLRWKRIGALALLALCPAPALVGTGSPLRPGAYPVPSAWMLGPPVAMGALRYLDGGKALGFASFEDCAAVAERVRKETAPDQILYFTWDRDTALTVAFLANRRVDVGAWEETMPSRLQQDLIRWYAYHDPHACYISRLGYGVPRDITEEAVGGLFLGLRDAEAGHSSASDTGTDVQGKGPGKRKHKKAKPPVAE